jgi:hypothetical protein
LGELTDYAGIAAGMQNSNYFVTTASGRFVLTLFERIDISALDFTWLCRTTWRNVAFRVLSLWRITMASAGAAWLASPRPC